MSGADTSRHVTAAKGHTNPVATAVWPAGRCPTASDGPGQWVSPHGLVWTRCLWKARLLVQHSWPNVLVLPWVYSAHWNLVVWKLSWSRLLGTHISDIVWFLRFTLYMRCCHKWNVKWSRSGMYFWYVNTSELAKSFTLLNTRCCRRWSFTAACSAMQVGHAVCRAFPEALDLKLHESTSVHILQTVAMGAASFSFFSVSCITTF